MSAMLLTDGQRDAMQDITDIAMRRAGSLLTKLLGASVNLSAPHIDVLALSEVASSVSSMFSRSSKVTAVRQSFYGYLLGEAIVIYGSDGCKELSDLMGYNEVLDRKDEIELLLDVSNILVGASLGGIVDQINGVTDAQGELSFSPPAIMAENVPAEILINPDKLTWTHALLMEVNFTLEGRNFVSQFCVLMPEPSIEKMRNIIQPFAQERLEKLGAMGIVKKPAVSNAIQ